MHEPLQSALHFVVQSAVVGTETHCVLQWSSQQALHEAWQSVEEDDDEELAAPSDSDEDEEVDVHDALHPDSQRELQSVVQSSDGGLVEHCVEQSDWQLDVQFASAEAVHCALHCCSSWAAQAFSQLAGAHCVEQSLLMTSEHCAFASMSMSPHAEIVEARAICGSAVSAAKASAVEV